MRCVTTRFRLQRQRPYINILCIFCQAAASSLNVSTDGCLVPSAADRKTSDLLYVTEQKTKAANRRSKTYNCVCKIDKPRYHGCRWRRLLVEGAIYTLQLVCVVAPNYADAIARSQCGRVFWCGSPASTKRNATVQRNAPPPAESSSQPVWRQ